MKVWCRCLKCNVLLTVEYDGKPFLCPSCGEVVLNENDDRVTEDYVCEKNGTLNVIGDEFDEKIAATDPDDFEELLSNVLGLEEEMHAEEIAKNSVPLNEAAIHDCVKYGKYFWIVIGIENDRKLLLSKECMYVKPEYEFGDKAPWEVDVFKETDYRWESSLYRSYLNTYYYENFFSEEDRKNIVPHTICIEKQGEKILIYDKVFLLNKKEVLSYLPRPEDRIATMHVLFDDVNRAWLLRNDNYDINLTDAVDEKGNVEVLSKGFVVDWFRPAIWVKR